MAELGGELEDAVHELPSYWVRLAGHAHKHLFRAQMQQVVATPRCVRLPAQQQQHHIALAPALCRKGCGLVMTSFPLPTTVSSKREIAHPPGARTVQRGPWAAVDFHTSTGQHVERAAPLGIYRSIHGGSNIHQLACTGGLAGLSRQPQAGAGGAAAVQQVVGRPILARQPVHARAH
eukprot:1138291-Pelagomonas_calceolata.AAC.7